MAIDVCKHCQRADMVRLRRQVAQNGVPQIFFHCYRCNRNAHPHRVFVARTEVQRWIDTGLLKVETIEDIPNIADYSALVQCDVCNAYGAEYHHWLPQAFRDVIPNHRDWPGAYLCKACHDSWHEVVTPYLPGRGASELAQYTKSKYFRGNGT